MRSIRTWGVTVAAALAVAALAGGTSASAASWSPTNTPEQATASLTLHSTGGMTITCSLSATYFYAPSTSPSVAHTTDATGTSAPPQFSGCSNSLGWTPTTVTSSTAWNFTANSTTSVPLSNGSMTITMANGICVITASNMTVSNNTWSNATHMLTAGNGTFPISPSGFCDGGTSMFWSGSVGFPSSLTIAP